MSWRKLLLSVGLIMLSGCFVYASINFSGRETTRATQQQQPKLQTTSKNMSRLAMAEGEGQRIARACAGDVVTLRKPSCQITGSRVEDFEKGGIIRVCLGAHLGSGQLSRPCWDAVMGGGG
jgi:hypothetical protein